MPPAAQALDVAMHITSEPEADPAALAHEMISLLRSVRTPGGAVSAFPRQTEYAPTSYRMRGLLAAPR
jgi:hypothetical protein